MNKRKKNSKFRLAVIDAFDARRGYRRCPNPGVGVSFGGRHCANADFWRDKSGRLVVRLYGGGYVLHFEASKNRGSTVRDEDLEVFGDFVAHTLVEWSVEGFDDLPSSIYANE